MSVSSGLIFDMTRSYHVHGPGVQAKKDQEFLILFLTDAHEFGTRRSDGTTRTRKSIMTSSRQSRTSRINNEIFNLCTQKLWFAPDSDIDQAITDAIAYHGKAGRADRASIKARLQEHTQK